MFVNNMDPLRAIIIMFSSSTSAMHQYGSLLSEWKQILLISAMSQVSVNCKFPQTSVKTVFEGLQKRVPVISFIATCHNARNHAAMQSQKAVTAYLKSEQPLHFDFARSVVEPRSSCSEISRWRTENKIHCFKKTISAVEYGPIRSFNTELTLLLREPIFHACVLYYECIHWYTS